VERVPSGREIGCMHSLWLSCMQWSHSNTATAASCMVSPLLHSADTDCQDLVFTLTHHEADLIASRIPKTSPITDSEVTTIPTCKCQQSLNTHHYTVRHNYWTISFKRHNLVNIWFIYLKFSGTTVEVRLCLQIRK